MAWFGDGLSSLSSLKGQITSFTKEVLSDGIVEEIDERSRKLNEANERCVQLQELLNSKDAEISLLRRQNCELQKAVVELNARPKESNDLRQDDEGEMFFWDPPSAKSRGSKGQKQPRQLEEQLAQAALRIRELEGELRRLQRVQSSSVRDEIGEGHQSGEFLRAKQDMVNRIIQLEEKCGESERSAKHAQLDETGLTSDFRTVISKLETPERLGLLRGALKALERENEKHAASDEEEKRDSHEKRGQPSANGHDSALAAKPSNREAELCRRIEELQQENRSLFSNIEELDQQHAESINELLSLKEEIERKHHVLQDAYEKLYVDFNEADGRAAELRDKLAALECSPESRSDRCERIEGVHRSLQTDPVERCERDAQWDLQIEEESAIVNGSTSEVERRIKEILRNSCVDTEPGESIIEAVARQYVDASWKKDVLERKVNEVTRELKETVETKDALQMECDDMQAHIDSLLMEIQRLKLNLPSIPEASEERVASLETETESLQEDVKQLQAENEEFRRRNNELAETVSRLETALNSRENVETELKIARQQLEDVERLRVENEEVRKRNDELAETVSRLETALSSSENLETELKSARQQLEDVERLRVENEEVRKRNDGLAETVSRLETALSSRENLETELKIARQQLEDVERLRVENEEVRKRNDELAETVGRFETALRNQENLETELKIARQQLEDAERQFEDASKIAEASETAARDLSRKLDASLDDNKMLANRIRMLESEDKRQRTTLAEAVEKCRSLEGNEARVESLKLDLENVTRELNASAESSERLKECVASLEEEKSGMERQHDRLRETNDEIRVGNAQLESMPTKSDASDPLDRIAKLRQELTAAQDELLSQAEFFNTEKCFLEQEHAADKEALNNYKEQLQEAEEKCAWLENQRSDLLRRVQELEAANESWASLAKLIDEIQREPDGNKRLDLLQNCTLPGSAEPFARRDRDAKIDRVSSEDVERLEQRLRASLDERERLERALTALQREYDETRAALSERLSSDERERRQIVATLEETSRRNSALESENGSLAAELSEARQRLQAAVDGNQDAAAMTKETIEALSNLIREKDEEIAGLKASAESREREARDEISRELATTKQQRDELVELVQAKHAESVRYHAEIQRLTALLNEQAGRVQSLTAERSEILAAAKDKDARLLWTQNELSVAQRRLDNFERENSGQVCGVHEHATQARELAMLAEKSDALEAALIQEQASARMLQSQLAESRGKEAAAARELERLRAHLVEMESGYTEEALIAEEARKELEARLLQAEEKLKNTSTVYTSASIRANQQVETLQQQINLIVQQRDDIQAKLSAAEDKVLAQTASLTNLQLVLEQFQRDKERDVALATQRIQNRLNESLKRQAALSGEVSELKEQLAEAKECLQAASRLGEQLDRKTERIEQLSQEVERLTHLVNTADRRIEEAKQSGEGKVDKNLVKNLLLGYVSSQAADKSSVLRVIATVLDFNESERDKSGLNNANTNAGWFARLSGSNGTPTKDEEASLSAAFVKFLESESKPKPQLPALPISTSPLTRPGHSRQHSTSSTQSTLLLPNVSLPTFPDFVPARNTGSILKEVLKDS